MLRSMREKAGLGSPPTPYYTNEVESKNRVLKEAVFYKSSQLPDFIQKMKSVLEQQKSEIERAVVNTGEYRLRVEYRHLSVESSKWFTLSREQRKRKIDRFMKSPLAEDTPSTSRSGIIDSLQDFPIPSHLREPIWDKANRLASDDSAIVKAPGAEDSWMVMSSSGERPHYVKTSKCAFACDDQCLSYKSMKLCSHTVALAIKTGRLYHLLRWYRSLKCSPNFTALAEAGKPKSAGKKPVRKGISKKCSREISAFLRDAEMSNAKWEYRCDATKPTEYAQETATAASYVCTSATAPTTATAAWTYVCTSATTPTTTTAAWTYVCTSATTPTTATAAWTYVCTSATTPTTATAYMVSNRDFNIGCIGGIQNTLAPPPLIPTHVSPSYGPLQPNSIPVIPQQASSISVVVPTQVSSASNVSPQPSNILNVQPQLCSFSPFVSSSRVSSQLPPIESPFWVAFIFGNVSRCQGCKGRIARSEDKSSLPLPDDIVLGHKEHVVYQNARSGMFEQSTDKRNVYYHPWRTCVVPHFALFNADVHIHIPPTVKDKLLPQHKALLGAEFGLTIP